MSNLEKAKVLPSKIFAGFICLHMQNIIWSLLFLYMKMAFSYDVVYFSKCVMWAASDKGKLLVLKLLLQHLTELISYWRLLLEGLYKEI